MWEFRRYTPPSHGTQYLFFQYSLVFCISAAWVSVVIYKIKERWVTYMISKIYTQDEKPIKPLIQALNCLGL